MNLGLKIGIITLLSTIVIATPAIIIDVNNNGEVFDSIQYSFQRLKDKNEDDIIINQVNNNKEIYTIINTKDKTHKTSYEEKEAKSFNDYECQIITTIDPKIDGKTISVSGSFGLKMKFELEDKVFDNYEDDLNYLKIQKLIDSNLFIAYDKETDDYGKIRYSIVDLNDSSIILEKIYEDKDNEIIYKISSNDQWNQIIKHKEFSIKNSNNQLFHDIGQYRVSIVLKEYFIDVDFSDPVIGEFKIHSCSNDILLNYGEYENSILLPKDGLKEKNYYQVNIVNYNKDKLYISNTEKINVNDLITFGVSYDGDNRIKNTTFDFYYFDSKKNEYSLVKTQKLFDKRRNEDRVLVGSEDLTSGKYKIVVSGSLRRFLRKAKHIEESYEYYFEF